MHFQEEVGAAPVEDPEVVQAWEVEDQAQTEDPEQPVEAGV